MKAQQFARRLGLIVLAITIASTLLRPQMSSALVTRGDELQFRGLTARSLALYARALAVDGRNMLAVDRYAFSALLSHDRDAEEQCARLTSAALRLAPDDLTIRFDRAMCEQRLRRFAEAAGDFASVGMRLHDPRTLLFAALDFHRIRARNARRLLALAAAQQPRYQPAVDDLIASGSWNT